ncbi:MAG: hypothetical protein M9894_11775 [Planctomycetes bacterium]|nr:hypothetical protein [Planctomycetota bacterium]
MGPRAASLLLASSLAIVGCREGSRPVALPAATAPAGTTVPYGNGAVTGAIGSATTPAASPSRVRVTLLGPGPQRVERDAQEVTALALRLEAAGPDPLEVTGLTLRAAGTLDDAAGTTTARLAIDVDGDGAFDRSVDRVLASAGFATNDGPLEFRFLALALTPAAPVDLLVVLDLSGQGEAHEDQRLAVEAAVAHDAAGGVAAVDLPAGPGPWLRVGAWVTPHEALAVAGEALRPRALRDAQGRTHVGLFQNLNMTSNVWYSLHDGRSFSPPDNVSRAGRTAWNQDLGLDAGGLPHLVWEQYEDATGDFAIRHSQFDPHAFAWTPHVVLSGTTGGMQVNPRVLVGPAGDVDVVWEDWGPSSTTPRVAHRRRAGGAWSQIAEVTSAGTSALLQARDPALAALPGGEALVAWAEVEPGRAEVRARRRTQAGWGPVEVVAQGQGVVERVELLDEGGTTHLLYVDQGRVLHARRTAQGWSRPVDVSRGAALASEPAMGLWQGELHVAWIEARNGGNHLAYARSQGGGFTAPELLTLGQGDVSRKHPVVVPEGDRLRLLWQDRRLGRQRIYTTWREAGALEAPRAVTAPAGDPGRPALALDAEGRLHAAWSVDAGGNAEVFHTVEDAPGAGFATPENVSRRPGGSYQPTLAAAGRALHLAWEQEQGGDFAVLVASRGPAGWSTPAAVSSGARAYAPRLAGLPDGRAALVWTEEVAPGDFDVHLALHDGRAFAPAVAVDPRAGTSAWSPAVALSSRGVAAVTWEEEGGGRREVLVATVDPTGTTVTGVASSPAGQYAPRVAWAGEDLWCAWVEDGRVRAALRRAGQPAFDGPLDLTTGGSWQPDLAVTRDGVAVAWEQWTGGDARVLLATLSPAGASAPVPLDEAPGPARRAALVAAPTGGLHAAWSAQGSIWTRARRAR